MKIIQVIPSLSSAGGAERFVIDLSISLQQLENEVLLIVLYKDEISFFQNEIVTNNINIKYLNKHKGFDFHNSIALRKAILDFAPDLVHTHLNCHLSMKLSGLWKKKNKILFFHTIHNVPENECSKPILFYIMKPLYKKHIVEPITISDSLSRETKSYYGLDFLPISIYNGIFVEQYVNNVPILERNTTFISVASFQPKKNQIMIAQASIILKERGYEVKTVFLGNGPEFEKVKKFVDDKKASEFIEFKGQVKNVSEYLNDSKCFVIPSWFEGNPISILEAMAAGLAVIATKIGGAKDVITNNVNGYLVDPTDLEDLTSKMELILKNNIMVSKFSKNNLVKILDYNMNKVAKRHIAFYGSKVGKV